jgi:ABC-2 type transport system permease protein
VTITGIISYLILIVNAFIIALAFHILTIASGILTTEVDNAIMLYRDTTQMGRIPIDIYKEPVSWIITFVIPVGIMMTFPAKALMGLLSLQALVAAIIISSLFLLGSLKLWKYALKNYTSPSS